MSAAVWLALAACAAVVGTTAAATAFWTILAFGMSPILPATPAQLLEMSPSRQLRRMISDELSYTPVLPFPAGYLSSSLLYL